MLDRFKGVRWEADVATVLLLRVENGRACSGLRRLEGYGDVGVDRGFRDVRVGDRRDKLRRSEGETGKNQETERLGEELAIG